MAADNSDTIERRKRQWLTIDNCLRVPMSVTGACRAAGISRETFYTWYRDDPNFTTLVDLARAFAEQKLIEMVLKEKRGARWIATNLFKDEYQERVSVKADVAITGLEFVNDGQSSGGSQEPTSPRPEQAGQDQEA